MPDFPETETFTGEEASAPEDGPTTEETPPEPFECTLYFRCGPPMHLVCTGLDPKVNPQTGRLYGGSIVQAHLEEGDVQTVYIDWNEIYAVDVNSIVPGKRRRR